ncbi:MAG: EF-hand domain-containing protein [Candidatus Devosia euplotis]|nr:EF-hand domain-containing protein [Candidatus Devosia euplotis]
MDEFFAHTDVDGDGQLSKDEFDVERTLRMAQSLDAGETAAPHSLPVRAIIDDGVTGQGRARL